jgi:chorismate mutase/prephenate dehydratase
MDIAALREHIDVIDEKILQLISKRAELALAIGAEKKRGLLAVHNPTREETIIRRILSLNQGPLPDKDVGEIFTIIIKACLNLQITQVTRDGDY